MSVITAKAEFAFDAPAQYSPQRAPGYAPDYAPRTIATHHAPTAPRGLRARLAGAAQWLAEQPRRRAVINELATLSDHELADIGLARGDLNRVFDRGFAAGRAA